MTWRHSELSGTAEAVAITAIVFIDHVLKLCLCRVLPKGPHHSANPILINETEGLLEFTNLLLSQLVRHRRNT